MNLHATDSAPFDAAAIEQHGDALARHVQELIDEANRASGSERRARDRFPIPFTFSLTPIDRGGKLMIDDTTTVVGKDLSLSGFGFSHDHPIRHRHVVISLDHPCVGRFAVEAEIVWTRPNSLGLYESGCRLMRTVDGHTLKSPVE